MPSRIVLTYHLHLGGGGGSVSFADFSFESVDLGGAPLTPSKGMFTPHSPPLTPHTPGGLGSPTAFGLGGPMSLDSVSFLEDGGKVPKVQSNCETNLSTKTCRVLNLADLN